MKKIFLIVLIFFSIRSFSQPGYPVKQTLGSDSTVITSKGAFKSRLIHWNFSDTADANAQHIDEYPGAQIFTSSDNKLWYRTADTSRWMIGSGSNRDTIGVTYDLYTDSLVNGINQGHQVIHRRHNDGLISGGIVSWTGTGLTFAISPAIYYINQNYYETPQDTITLDPSDPSLPRRDVFVVDTIPDIGFITGTAAADPVTPQAEPASQIILAEILLNAGDLTPSNVVVNKIYDENIEWTTLGVGTVTVDFDNTDNPFTGTKAAYVSTYSGNGRLHFTYGGLQTLNEGQTLKLQIYLNGAFTNKLKLRFFNTGVAASTSLTITAGFGFNPLDSNNWQLVSIPLSAFQWSSTAFNGLVLTMVGSDVSGSNGFYLDDVQLQTGINNIAPIIDYSNKLDSVTITKTTVGTDTTNTFKQYVKGVAKTIGTVWTGKGIYTADNGTSLVANVFKLGGIALSANTDIPTSAFTLTIASSHATATINSTNTNSGGAALRGNHTDGTGVRGSVTTGTGALGIATTGTGVAGSVTSGTAVDGLATTGLAGYFTIIPTTTNTVVPVIKLQRGVSGTAANGVGGSIEFYNEVDGGSTPITNAIKTLWSDATTATRTSQFEIWGVNSAATARKLALTGAGALILDGYNTLPTYADEAAAVAAGLAQNTVYKTATGELRIKL